MTQQEQEMFTAMVADKCKQALAPLYAQLEELRAKYYPTMEKVEPQPTPEEVEERELEKNRKRWQKLANELREQGKIQ